MTNDTSRRVAAIWSELLNMSELSAEDNFFELGGDSVAATQCLNRIREAFGCRIPLATFLERSMTLGKLAGLVDEMVNPAR